jgi:hypothetical protein
VYSPDSPLGLPALNEREALANLLDSLEVAEQAARQLAFHTDRREWMVIGSNFGQMRSHCAALAQQSLAARP